MNKQLKYKDGELVGRGIEWINAYGTYEPYTWNPIRGCKHACKWEMPDGAVAECYAKLVAERLATKAYSKGFAELSFDEKELMKPYSLKKPSGIFADSMSDLVGIDVPSEWVERVIRVMRDTPQHIYFVLTKNPPRLKNFNWPTNAWIGVSAPPTYMHGKKLSLDQQKRWYSAALQTLSEIPIPVRWSSVEPLSWDVAPIVARYPDALNWAVIGAASNGRNQYPPSETFLRKLLMVLEIQSVPVFYKGNLRSLPYAAENWREEFPETRTKDVSPVAASGRITIESLKELEAAFFQHSAIPAMSQSSDAELAALQRQYAEMCDRAQRAEEALKPFAHAYQSAATHWPDASALTLYAGPTAANISDLLADETERHLTGAHLKTVHDLLVAQGVIEKVVAE